MKLIRFFLATVFIAALGACTEKEDEDPVVKETFSAIEIAPLSGTPGEISFEQVPASEIAGSIPCEIIKEQKEVTLETGGFESVEYSLTLYKWKNAEFSKVSKTVIDFEVYSADVITYTFTPGEYTFESNGRTYNILVSEQAINIIHPVTHEVLNTLLYLEDYRRTYRELADHPIRKYSDTDTSTYSASFTLIKLAEDHFYIENEDYTFEGYITYQGVELSQIKPVEKEIGLLYR